MNSLEEQIALLWYARIERAYAVIRWDETILETDLEYRTSHPVFQKIVSLVKNNPIQAATSPSEYIRELLKKIKEGEA